MSRGTWTELSSTEVEVCASSLLEASAGLRMALSRGPHVRTIRLLLDPKGGDMGRWLDSAKAATPEFRGVLVQAFFARIFRMAGYEVTVGKRVDIFARNRLRSLYVEVKSSMIGTKFGSRMEIAQLEKYVVVSERQRAEIYLATMGLAKPMELRDRFRSALRARKIGFIDARWISPQDTLNSHFPSVG